MKTRITQHPGGFVTLAYDEPLTGARIERKFFCRDARCSYVREILPNGNTTQPCDGLSSRGPTLVADGRDDLLVVIRREYRRMRRAEARLMSGL